MAQLVEQLIRKQLLVNLQAGYSSHFTIKNLNTYFACADMAQLVEQLIRNQ